MGTKILLEENRYRDAVNVSNTIGVDLTTKSKTLQGNSIYANLSLYEQYLAERDACDKYRFIFVVNPICSNVLFNVQTEIVQNEGSEDAIVLTDLATSAINPEDVKREDGTVADTIQNTSKITRKQAIKDTEYSHKSNGGFVYHCGMDIFDNHMLRSDTFAHVNMMNSTTKPDSKEVYNTIEDYMRDGEGNFIENMINPNDMEKTRLHLYNSEGITTLRDAYLNRIKEKDGWIGFTNPGYIDIPNSGGKSSGVTINRMLANNKACEFIDMYPDRSLYSFLPKYNKFRQRPEKNWDYCLTYPYSADTDMVDTVCGGYGGTISTEAVYVDDNAIMYKSSFKHTLSVGSYINIYYYSGDTASNAEDLPFVKYPLKVKISSVGNLDGAEKDRYFSIRISDVKNIYENISEEMFYKKVSNGSECQYYFRIYKKIKRKDSNGDEQDLRSDVNKLAFAENIYGDRVAQVVFTDDVDISELEDHRGRPVSEIYFTVVKRNAGHDEWYDNSTNDYSSSGIEFSHCFGEVTAGVDFGPSSAAQFDYNIRYLHNIDITGTTMYKSGDLLACSSFGQTILFGVPSAVCYDITIDDDTFYGNVVEFDPSYYTETEITPVLYRFNTAQREYKGSKYNKMPYDKLKSDDYDFRQESGYNGRLAGFKVEEENLSETKYGTKMVAISANICPEGYFYNPHTRIQLKEDSESVEKRRAKLINYKFGEGTAEFVGVEGLESTTIKIAVPTDYNFKKGDYIAFYDEGGIVDGVYYPPVIAWGEIKRVDSMKLNLSFEGVPFGKTSDEIKGALSNGPDRRFRAYYSEDAIPTYAAFDKETRSFVWRGFVSPSLMTQDSELYDIPFANGHFYIEKNITFFLRRQDPFGDFGLLWAKGTDIYNPMEYFRLESSSGRLDLSSVYNFYNNLNNICY